MKKQTPKKRSEEDLLESLTSLIDKLTIKGKTNFSDSDIVLLRQIKFYFYERMLEDEILDQDDIDDADDAQ